MSTSQASSQVGFLKYSHTIGLCTMSGRGFYYPVDTAIGEDDRLYTVNRTLEGDNRGLRVTIYDLDSEYFGTFGEFGEGEGQLIWPTAIARDRQGNTYVSDEYSNRITIYDVSGKFAARWGSSGTDDGQLEGPSGLAFDNEENLYVVDHQNHRVQKFTRDGKFLSSFGSEGSGEGEFSFPWGVTINSHGEIYVADWQNDRIQKFSPDGQFLASYGMSGRGDGQFHLPASVAVDAEHNMYVADWGNERVQVLDPEGGFVMKLRGEATHSKWADDFLGVNLEEAAARANSNMEPDIEFFNDSPHEESSHIEKYFWRPCSVKLDEAGRLYVTESNRHRLQIFERTQAD